MENNLIDKIRKLLALAEDGNSDHESHSALAKAKELMAQYKINEKDLKGDNKEKKCIEKESIYKYGVSSSDTYLNTLSTIIADNFCCVQFVKCARGSKTKRICFLGFEEDVMVCEEAMNIAVGALKRGINRVWKDLQLEYDMSYIPTTIWTPSKLGYTKGYMKGLYDVFQEQKAKHQEWGLVLVVPEEAKNFISNLQQFSLKSRSYSSDYYNDGYNDGRNFNMNKKLDGDTIKNLE